MDKEQIDILEEEMTVVEQQKVETTPMAKKSGAWKSVLIGGVPGVIFGAAGAAFAQEVVDVNLLDETDETDDSADVSHFEPEEIGVEVAESVNDDMSFGEAFGAAREEVGPGGVFEWHGNLYNTYSASEWEAMSNEDRQEFASNVYNTQAYDDDSSEGDSESVTVEDTIDGNEEASEFYEDDVVDVQVYEVGSVASDEGDIMNVAVASIDGHDAVFLDVDNDGLVDGVLVDSNDDGVIDDNEIIETPGAELDMSYLAMMTDSPEDSMYEGTPDYTNDADTSSLA